MAMKEEEMEWALPEWHCSRQSYEISDNLFVGMVGVADKDDRSVAWPTTNTTLNPTELDKNVKLKSEFTIYQLLEPL